MKNSDAFKLTIEQCEKQIRENEFKKIRKEGNTSYIEYKYKIEELKESLQENISKEGKLLSLLLDAFNDFRGNNTQISNSCISGFNDICNITSISSKRIEEIKIIIDRVIETVEQELKELEDLEKQYNLTNKKSENHSQWEGR